MAHRDERHQCSSTVLLLCCLISAAVVLLPACSSTPSGTSGPRLVTPKPVGGSSGIGPRVVSDAPSSAHGTSVQLGDRAVTVDDATTRAGTEPTTTVVTVNLAITNTGDVAIPNQAAFFQLMGSAGDAFAARVNGADPFYAAIAPRTTRSGSITFEVPSAAAEGLHLFYRPEVATEAVILPLSIR